MVRPWDLFGQRNYLIPGSQKREPSTQGYLLSMLGKAASSVGDHDHVVAASAHYVRSPEPGPVVIEAQLLRGGRTASQVRARLEQEGQVCVEALVTTAHLDGATAPYWTGGLPARSHSSYEDCSRLIPRLPDGNPVAIMEQIDVRLDPDSESFTTGRPSGRGELRGWLALPEAEAFDPASLLFAVDAYPPATFDIEFAGWVPTLELTVYVRALALPGPIAPRGAVARGDSPRCGVHGVITRPHCCIRAVADWGRPGAREAPRNCGSGGR